MIDKLSNIQLTSTIAETSEIVNSTIENKADVGKFTEITNSFLNNEVIAGDYSKIVNSRLENKVQIGRSNTILYSTIGDYSYTGQNTTILNAKVGRFNSISWNVSIGGNTHDMNKVTTHSFLVYPKWGMGGNSNWKSVYEECTLENDIWVAAGVNILRGVKVGSGAIIGAGTVVTKDVPPYAVVVGNPGKIIKMRCSDAIIEKMLELQWWNFPNDIIRNNFEVFNSELNMDIVKKLEEIKEGFVKQYKLI